MTSYQGGLFTLLLILFVAWLAHSLSSLQNDRGPVVIGSEICILITGGVEHGGVYVFGRKPLLTEVINRAGGLSARPVGRGVAADYHVAHGTRIHVSPEDGHIEVMPNSIPAFYKVTLRIPLSLNTANEEELEAIPYIGSSLAKAIIRYRFLHGSFSAVEQIKALPGVGNIRYARIRPYVGI